MLYIRFGMNLTSMYYVNKSNVVAPKPPLCPVDMSLNLGESWAGYKRAGYKPAPTIDTTFFH
jgi:hypothetical protein